MKPLYAIRRADVSSRGGASIEYPLFMLARRVTATTAAPTSPTHAIAETATAEEAPEETPCDTLPDCGSFGDFFPLPLGDFGPPFCERYVKETGTVVSFQ